jgi:hypothetical protein
MRFGIVVFMIHGLLTRSIGESNNKREAGLDMRGFCSSRSLPDRVIHTCETRRAENRSFAQYGRVSAQYQTRGTNEAFHKTRWLRSVRQGRGDERGRSVHRTCNSRIATDAQQHLEEHIDSAIEQRHSPPAHAMPCKPHDSRKIRNVHPGRGPSKHNFRCITCHSSSQNSVL